MKARSGNTPVITIESLQRKYNLPKLYVKDESRNPFGTFKDRRSEDIIERSLQKKIHTLVLITAGNAGYSLANYAKNTKLKVVCIVDKKISSLILAKLTSTSAIVIRLDLSKQRLTSDQLIKMARITSNEKIWDVTNGWEQSYEAIIKEIARLKPKYIVTPVGSGESFVGLYNGIKKFKLISTLIGITSGKHPSIADKLNAGWTPYSDKLRMITKENHSLIKLPEADIRRSYTLAKQYLTCEPSSALVFGVLDRPIFKNQDTVVIINSGRTK